jgi:hypothetical protein
MSDLFLIIHCPHCQGCIIVKKKEINCRIFRHGIITKTKKQINPHENKKTCDLLKKKGLIYGCGKPFKLNNVNVPEICGYI